MKIRLLPWRSYRQPSAARGPSPASQATGYKAFISYSHAVDGKLAPALHDALHRFAKPWYRPRALRVFHDQANLAANPGLWSSIQAALADSEFLVLLASPQAAQSEWVARSSPQRGADDLTCLAVPPDVRALLAPAAAMVAGLCGQRPLCSRAEPPLGGKSHRSTG